MDSDQPLGVKLHEANRDLTAWVLALGLLLALAFALALQPFVFFGETFIAFGPAFAFASLFVRRLVFFSASCRHFSYHGKDLSCYKYLE